MTTLKQAGFTDGMQVKIRVMPDCIVITTQNSLELWGCAEELSVMHVNRPKMLPWFNTFPGELDHRRWAG
ncbi:TPA: SymE family type I addiction module toxin [Escherichia coli]